MKALVFPAREEIGEEGKTKIVHAQVRLFQRDHFAPDAQEIAALVSQGAKEILLDDRELGIVMNGSLTDVDALVKKRMDEILSAKKAA